MNATLISTDAGSDSEGDLSREEYDGDSSSDYSGESSTDAGRYSDQEEDLSDEDYDDDGSNSDYTTDESVGVPEFRRSPNPVRRRHKATVLMLSCDSVAVPLDLVDNNIASLIRSDSLDE